MNNFGNNHVCAYEKSATGRRFDKPYLEVGVMDDNTNVATYEHTIFALDPPLTNAGIIGVSEGPYALKLNNTAAVRIALAIYIDGVNIADASSMPHEPKVYRNHSASVIVSPNSNNSLNAWMTKGAPRLVFTKSNLHKVAFNLIADAARKEGKIIIFAFGEQPVFQTANYSVNATEKGFVTRGMGTGAGQDTNQSWGSTDFPRPYYLGTTAIFYTNQENVQHLGETKCFRTLPVQDYRNTNPLDVIPDKLNNVPRIF